MDKKSNGKTNATAPAAAGEVKRGSIKNSHINMLIVGLLLLVAMSVVLVVFIEYAHDVFDDNITVSSDGVTTSVKAVRDLRLTPTQSKTYSVNLVCEASGDYYIFLDYEETADGGMKRFVNVTVRLGDEVVYEGDLATLLDTDKVIEFEGTLEADDPLPVDITYEMPYETGNEAQGTSSDFNVKFTIKKK